MAGDFSLQPGRLILATLGAQWHKCIADCDIRRTAWHAPHCRLLQENQSSQRRLTLSESQTDAVRTPICVNAAAESECTISFDTLLADYAACAVSIRQPVWPGSVH